MAGTLFVVATPIGNLEDITARALRVLREVALIAAEDTRRTSHLLARYGIATRTTSLHEHNERRKTSGLIDRLNSGESIALVSDAGTPTFSDPGTHLISEAISAGIRIEPIPGPNAVIAALSVFGLTTDQFVFMGFPPIRSKHRNLWLENLRKAGTTVVFYEAPHRIRRTLEEIRRSVGDVHVMVAREMTKVHEELVRGPISGVLDKIRQPIGEFTVVVSFDEMTNSRAGSISLVPEPAELRFEFGELTNIYGHTRRRAIASLSKKYRISAKEVYAMLETAKQGYGLT